MLIRPTETPNRETQNHTDARVEKGNDCSKRSSRQTTDPGESPSPWWALGARGSHAYAGHAECLPPSPGTTEGTSSSPLPPNTVLKVPPSSVSEKERRARPKARKGRSQTVLICRWHTQRLKKSTPQNSKVRPQVSPRSSKGMPQEIKSRYENQLFFYIAAKTRKQNLKNDIYKNIKHIRYNQVNW